MDAKIDIDIIRRAVRNKSVFDALCLAVFFKARYANSLVYKHSAREMKSITHLGSERLSKSLKMGYKVGLFKDDMGSMKVVRMHKEGKRYIVICQGTSFKDIAKTLREGLILNKVRQISFIANTIGKAEGTTKLSKRELKWYKKNRQSMDEYDNDLKGTIRKDTFAKIVNLSKSSVHRLIKGLVEGNKIMVKHRFVPLKYFTGQVSLNSLNEYGNDFYVMRQHHEMVLQIANEYRIKIA